MSAGDTAATDDTPLMAMSAATGVLNKKTQPDGQR